MCPLKGQLFLAGNYTGIQCTAVMPILMTAAEDFCTVCSDVTDVLDVTSSSYHALLTHLLSRSPFSLSLNGSVYYYFYY